MSEAGDRAAERDGRLACCHVREGGRERLAESAATCRASSSIWAVRVLMSASDDATRATHVRGVTSAMLSANWATSSNATCAYVAIMAIYPQCAEEIGRH